MEQHAVQSQILIFESLQEFTDSIDNSIDLHKSELARYEEELGQMLREIGQDNAESEWSKELQSKLTERKQTKNDDKKEEKKEKGEERKEKKKEKNKKEKERKEKKQEKGKKSSTNWKGYKDIQFFTGSENQGKTELYFEAVKDLKATLEKLDRIRETIEQLTSIGLGRVIYVVYFKNGMPEKLIFQHGSQEEGKFEFKADFVTEGMEVPI